MSTFRLTGSDTSPAVAAFRQLLMTLVAWLSFDGTPGVRSPPIPQTRLPHCSIAGRSGCRPIGQHCKVPRESLATARKERVEHKKRNKVGLHQSFVMRRATRHAHALYPAKRTVLPLSLLLLLHKSVNCSSQGSSAF